MATRPAKTKHHAVVRSPEAGCHASLSFSLALFHSSTRIPLSVKHTPAYGVLVKLSRKGIAVLDGKRRGLVIESTRDRRRIGRPTQPETAGC